MTLQLLRVLLVGLVGLIIACGDDADPTPQATDVPASPTEEAAPALRVATVNLLHGFFSDVDADTLTERLGLVAEALQEEEIDIVGLQEVSITSYGGNTAEELARQLGFEFVYRRSNPNIVDVDNDVLIEALDFEEGSAIVSRFPIADSESIDLARVSDTEIRIGLRATVTTPWGEIDVYVTHLTGGDEAEINTTQAQELADWITSRPRELPAVLMGDFNALEGSATIDLLTEAFVDVYRAADGEGPGYTCCQDALTDPEPEQNRKRIDYLFLAPGQTFAGEVEEARVFLDAAFRLPDGSDLWASDHFGLLAVVRFFSTP